MDVAFMAWAFAAGAAIPVQAGLNAVLSRSVGGPLVAAFVSFLVGTLVLLAYNLATGTRWPRLPEMASVPLWAWVGGALGAFFVVSFTATAPKLGAATMIGCIIAGQLTISLLLDHFGLVGYAEQAITPLRLLGAMMLLGGVLLVRLG
ncbi:DMT family transporter [Oceanibacterium hippocampi]|uniref:Inner membrane protein YdcZ n=1 Tax=Oceanibacterium hippocampi TaxID=745714 RepID=A0A1Y5SK99_9PROT|nr:DMT family transporter [Oceanibacterium hippocampi]SLN39626.1 hypothetical protein OCH7691_01656 [Oceanibacterium hippocampi]